MKKYILVIALALLPFCAGAFEFDGIDLNSSYIKVTQEIAKRGYIYNHELNCLEGDCQGTRIYLNINYIDVKQPGQLGQLIVNIPMRGNQDEVFSQAVTLFDVIYHRVKDAEGKSAYQVDTDGTQLLIGRRDGFITLTYNTPAYSVKKSAK